MKSVALILLTSVGLLTARGALAQPLEIKISGPASAFQGEPLILNWTLTNTTSERVAIKLDASYNLPLNIQLKHPQTVAVRLTRLGAPRYQRRFGYLILGKGSSLSGRQTLIMPFPVVQPGNHDLVVHGDFQYQPLPVISEVGEFCFSSATESRLPLRVDPSDDGLLRRLADKVALKAEQSPQGVETEHELDYLFAFPEEVAPVWQDLLHSSRLSGEFWLYALDRLSQRATPLATAVITSVWDDTSVPEGIRQMAKASLQVMWTRSDPSLKQKIETIYTAHAGKMFDVEHQPNFLPN
jgi:hypothetical protein